MQIPRDQSQAGTAFQLVVLTCLLVGCGTQTPARAVGETATDELAAAWRQSSVWDDGNAEFCAYEVNWFRYGVLNPGRALLIAVKEPWAPDLEVKADRPRRNGFDVIKLNHVRDVATGIYTYHQMASAFMRRDNGELRKLAVTSSEGCGISTANLVGGRLETRSYFDGQGEMVSSYPKGALAVDGLALFLRDYLVGEPSPEVTVFPSLMTGRFPALEPARYRLERTRSEREVPAGKFETIELRLAAETDWLQFSFAAESPHPLIRYQDSLGTTYRLAKCERIPYWQLNRPGGEEWLPEAVR